MQSAADSSTTDSKIGPQDRRSAKRYGLNLAVRWTMIRRRKVLESGAGKTLDLSSDGLLFEADREVPAGMNVELSIDWPVLLNGSVPLQLLITGRVVRFSDRRAGVRITHHEFRTARKPAERRSLSSAVESRTQPAISHG